MIGNIILILQFLVGMSIIVGLHELGHLLMAKMFGMRVESYGIGMPPKVLSKKIGETEYYIGAIPFGGAVVISGMIEEVDDKSAEVKTPKPWEFSSKPAWKRLLVILGGIIFNFISSIIIFSGIASYVGEEVLTKSQLNENGIAPTEIGRSLGLAEGDKILEINGKTDFVFSDDLFNNTKYEILISRNSEKIKLSGDVSSEIASQADTKLFTPIVGFYVDDLIPGGAAEKAGLQKGDEVIEVADTPTPYLHTLKSVLSAHKNSTVNVVYKRNGEVATTEVNVSNMGTMEIIVGSKIEKVHRYIGPIKALTLGTERFFTLIKANVEGLCKMITGKTSFSRSISGPVGIAKIFGKQFEVLHFITIVASLSAMLGLMNLLPLPALDGGHTILILLELISRRKLSPKILQKIQYFGVSLLLLVAAFTVINDIANFLK